MSRQSADGLEISQAEGQSLESPEPLSEAQRLLEEIKANILSGKFAAGLKLTETDLATMFGVSRAPLREALLRLEERRLIARVPFSGTRVLDVTEKMLSDLYEVREVLEGLACRRLGRNITSDQIAELFEILERNVEIRRSMRKGQQPQAMSDFHVRIAEMSENRELERLLKQEIWQLVRNHYDRWIRPPERVSRGFKEHIHIAEALARRDGELAEILMRRHVQGSWQDWHTAMSRPAPSK